MSSQEDMDPKIIVDQVEARALWQDLLRNAVVVSPFDDFDFLDGLAALYGWSVKTVVWGHRLGVRFVERSRIGIRDIVVPPFVPFSSVLLSSEVPLDERLNTLNLSFHPLSGLPDSRLISLHPTLGRIGVLSPTGYSFREKATFEVPTGSKEEVLSRLSESTARKYKKSHDQYDFRAGEIESVFIADMVKQAYDKHSKRFSLPTGALGVFCDGLTQRQFATSVGAYNRDSGALEAGIVLLMNEDTAWYWLAGSQPGPAMTVLLVDTLVHLKTLGRSSMDLMGANTPGITEFKRRFGGDLVNYPHLHKSTFLTALLSSSASYFRKLT